MEHSVDKPARSRTKRLAARVLPIAAALSGVGGLLMLANPQSVAVAVGRFDMRVVLPVVLLVLLFYVLQGLRWHLLLRHVGVAQGLADSQLVNLAGQGVTAVLPLGDLTRALMVSRTSGVQFGRTAATVTVQELTFTLLVVAAAAPGLSRLPAGLLWMTAVITGIAAAIAVLMVPRLFSGARRVIAATPGLRRSLADIEALQRETRHLLGRPDVLAGSALDLGRVVIATAALLLVLRGLHIDSLGWWDVALVLAASFVGGALSMLPGGVGANEASVVGVLIVVGVNPAAAAAAAMLQRLSLTLVPAVGGAVAYALLTRRRRRVVVRRDVSPRGTAARSCPALGLDPA